MIEHVFDCVMLRLNLRRLRVEQDIDNVKNPDLHKIKEFQEILVII